MRKMLRCRRGSVAFATVVALVPLIGFVALGAEAGSWYVVKQHAQNAADSAALSGAFAIANSDSQASFGTLNGFPSNVTVTQGSYSSGSGFVAGGAPANAVQAVVTDCAPQTLSLVVYTGSCNGTPNSVLIKAQAVASVEESTKVPCVLATQGAITFQDAAVQINAPNCGIASNGDPTTGIGITFKTGLNQQPVVGSITTHLSCTGVLSLCESLNVKTYQGKITDQFAALTTAINGLTLTACNPNGPPYQPYATGLCAYDSQNINSQTSLTQSGVYFFSGGLSLGGNGSLATATGVSATIIVLPVSGNKTSLKMAGGATFNITAPTTAPSALPSQLASVAKLLKNMALFDPETSPQTTGTSTMSGSGVFYLPNATFKFQGTSTGQVSTCTEVIAASIQLAGTPNFNNSGCDPSILLVSQIVKLVQ